VDGEVYLLPKEFLLDFLRKEALVADFRKGTVEDFVPLGGYRNDFDLQRGVKESKQVDDEVGLPEGKLASAGPDAELFSHLKVH